MRIPLLRRLFRSLETLGGMLRGFWAGRHVRPSGWEERESLLAEVDVVSFDVFDTLLHRPDEFESALFREMKAWIQKAGAPEGCSLEGVLRRLRAEKVCMGRDPEISHRAAFERLLSDEGDGLRSEDLAQRELEWHVQRTKLDARVAAFLESSRKAGKRIIAVSDMYLGAKDLGRLLGSHGGLTFDRIYASCDVSLSKFRGGLFDHVLAEEGISPARMLHVGDRLVPDVLMPRARGIRAMHFRLGQEEAYRVGYAVLGPILVDAAALLLQQAASQQVRRLAFVARDGHLLMEIVERMVSSLPFQDRPACQYVYLSRRATALLGVQKLGLEAVREVARVRAGGGLARGFCEYFGLDPRWAEGFEEAVDAEALLPMLAQAGFAEHVRDRRAEQVALVRDYLVQEGLYGSADVLWVDIGWRGTTQRALCQGFEDDPAFVMPSFCYLGLWAEGETSAATIGPALGLIMDMNRGRSVVEGALWQVSLLLESLCRAPEGTLLGFRRELDGRVSPRLDEGTRSRNSETETEAARLEIRKGILTYLAWEGASALRMSLSPRALRRRTQWRVVRFAFFPGKGEITAFQRFVHTEGHAREWCAHLIRLECAKPWRNPRGWLQGLTSPWRAGYVRATGGLAFAAAFFLVEAALHSLPAGLREGLRTFTLAAAGKAKSLPES